MPTIKKHSRYNFNLARSVLKLGRNVTIHSREFPFAPVAFRMIFPECYSACYAFAYLLLRDDKVLRKYFQSEELEVHMIGVILPNQKDPYIVPASPTSTIFELKLLIASLAAAIPLNLNANWGLYELQNGDRKLLEDSNRVVDILKTDDRIYVVEKQIKIEENEESQEDELPLQIDHKEKKKRLQHEQPVEVKPEKKKRRLFNYDGLTCCISKIYNHACKLLES